LKPAAFTYRRSDTVEGTIAELAELGDEAKIISGGLSLAPMMNFRLVRPSALVDVTKVPDLQYVETHGEELRIGALTPHNWIEAMEDEEQVGRFPILKRAARWVGHYPIRTRGTFGGSVAHADPSAEWCMIAMLLDAQIVAVGPNGQRTIPASEFFYGFFMNALDPDEMLVEVRFPRPAPHSTIQEFARRAGDYAIVAAAVDVSIENGKCVSTRIVLGGVSDTPLRSEEAEGVLKGQEPTAEAFEAAGLEAARTIEPGSDLQGDAQYKKDLAAVLIRRALTEAVPHGD
jgi:carbon-monoxide dehydrogenase medium subunit